MMNAALTFAAALALSGCVTTALHDPSHWTKPTATVQEVTFDDMECERQSRDILGTRDLIVGGVIDIPRLIMENGQRDHIYTRCMTERGYEKKVQHARAS